MEISLFCYIEVLEISTLIFQASFLPKPEEVITVDSLKLIPNLKKSDADDQSQGEELSSLLPQEGDEEEEEESSLNVFNDSNKDLKDPRVMGPSVVLDLDQTDHSRSSTTVQLNATRSQSQSVFQPDKTEFLHPKVRARISADLDVTDHNQSGAMVRKDQARSSFRSQSHSGLVDIDTSFTPYKTKDNSKANLPKMKIFLPKDVESSSSEEEETNLTS